MTDLVGYQERTVWMGQEVLTLAELWPAHPRAMIVGLNPAPASVEAGHYYQGLSGQRQLRRLVCAEVLAPPKGGYFEESALAAEIGFTDIVRRPTAGEGGVSKAEIAHGSTLLAESLAAHEVHLVICVFRHPVKALLGRSGPPGVQTQRTTWGAQVFRMPGPFQEARSAVETMTQLREFL